MGVITSKTLYGSKPAEIKSSVPATAIPEEPLPEPDIKAGSYLGIVLDALSEIYNGFLPGSHFHKLAYDAILALDAHVKSRMK